MLNSLVPTPYGVGYSVGEAGWVGNVSTHAVLEAYQPVPDTSHAHCCTDRTPCTPRMPIPCPERLGAWPRRERAVYSGTTLFCWTRTRTALFQCASISPLGQSRSTDFDMYSTRRCRHVKIHHESPHSSNCAHILLRRGGIVYSAFKSRAVAVSARMAGA